MWMPRLRGFLTSEPPFNPSWKALHFVTTYHCVVITHHQSTCSWLLVLCMFKLLVHCVKIGFDVYHAGRRSQWKLKKMCLFHTVRRVHIVLFSLFFGVKPFLKHKQRRTAIGTGCSATKRQKALISVVRDTRVGTLIVATIYLQLIQNRYMFRSFTVLHCSHQHCVQPVASDVEVVRYL